MLIIMLIISIMAKAMDTTDGPDTRSAGALLKMFSNFAVIIFFVILLNVIKRKNLSAADRREV